MAPPSKPWFRFYTEALADRKLRRLRPEQRWLWVAVLGAARMSRVPGALYVGEDDPMTAEDLADVAAMPVKDVIVGMAAFVEAGMVDVNEHDAWVVCRWMERQFESDVSTKRTQKHRSMERSIAVPETAKEQPMERPQNTETEAETEEERLTPDRAAEPAPKPTARAVVDDAGFDEFWSSYPRRDGVRIGKAKAKAQWSRIPVSKRPAVMAALHAYAAFCTKTERFPKDAERWLPRWQEWADAADGATPEATRSADPERPTRIRNGVREVFSPGAGWCAERAPRELVDFEQ